MPMKDICLQLVEDSKVLRKNGKLIIPSSLWHRAVAWYHHYLQHPGHLRLKENNEIRDVLERYAYYHPEIHQILQMLPG